MTAQTTEQLALAEIIVEALEIDDVAAAEIVPTAPLFGDDADGLGLDSIDALEIALAVSQNYGVELQADDENNRQIFATLESLNSYIQANRAA